MKRPVFWLAAGALVVTGAALGATQIRWNGGIGGQYGNYVGVPVHVQRPFSIGMAELKAGGRVRIESVRLHRPAGGVVLVGALVHPITRGLTGSDDRFPPTFPRAPMRAADGAILPAHSAAGLVVGLAATREGTFSVQGVDVLYRESWHGIDYAIARTSVSRSTAAPAEPRRGSSSARSRGSARRKERSVAGRPFLVLGLHVLGGVTAEDHEA